DMWNLQRATIRRKHHPPRFQHCQPPIRLHARVNPIDFIRSLQRIHATHPPRTAMLVAELIKALNSIAPESLAGSWDNVGLLVGDSSLQLDGPVFLTLDLTDPVIDEAIACRAGFVIAYHPPLFH